MAQIVLGIGMSHTPLFTLSSDEWVHRAAADRANLRLNLSDGRFISYGELLAERGATFESEAAPEVLEEKAVGCDSALEYIADAIQRAQPDVLLIVGDDQGEMFNETNQPAFAIFHAEELATSDIYGREDLPEWVRKMGRGYMMDRRRPLPGHPKFAQRILRGLVDEGVDVSSVAALPTNLGAEGGSAGLGHAFGFVVHRVLRGRQIPIVPLLLNTYYPPNVPTATRCHDIGRALRRVLEHDKSALRVAIVASGGLSHFVVDSELDTSVLGAMAAGNPDVLRELKREQLNSGSSEILNWVLAAGALEGLHVVWSRYFPIYRTPAGTGIGAGFAVWESEHLV